MRQLIPGSGASSLAAANSGRVVPPRRGGPPSLMGSSSRKLKGAILQNEGAVLYNKGQFTGAVAKFKSAQELLPDDLDVIMNLGAALRASGSHSGAMDYYDLALKIDGQNANAYYGRANVLIDIGRMDDAILNYQKAIQLNPRHAQAKNNLALAHSQLGDQKQALTLLSEAIDLDPSNASFLFNRGSLRHRLGDLAGAISDYDSSISLDDRRLDAYNNAGNVLREMSRPLEALQYFDRLLKLDPMSHHGLNNKSATLISLGRSSEAVPLVDLVLDQDPDNADAWDNIANIKLMHDFAPKEALECYDRAIRLEPENARIRWNRSLVDLLLGNFERGWEDFECRWDFEGFVKANHRILFTPEWDGSLESVGGKRLLVYGEQGIGDVIQFFRYVPVLRHLGLDVVLLVNDSLKALVQGSAGGAKIITRWPERGEYDLHAPLMSMPFKLRGLSVMIFPSKYIFVDPLKLSLHRGRLGRRVRPRVGIAWSGNPRHKNDANRSIALDAFLSAFPEGLELHSLQKEYKSGELEALSRLGIVDHSGHLRDLSDTAALVEQMDVVVTVDTSIAHLSGALGKTCWILLPYMPDWRWGMAGSDTEWYPAASLYRQSEPGNWGGVFQRVRGDLCSKFFSPTTRLDSVQALVKAGRYPEARTICEEALSEAPNDFQALYLLGLVLVTGYQDFHGALGIFERANGISPNNPGVLNNIGIAMLGLERKLDALDVFERVLSVSPNHEDTLFNRGRLLIEMDDVERGIADLDVLLSVDRANAKAYIERGLGRRKLGDYGLAMADIAMGIACDPSSGHAHNALGIIFLDLGKYAEAIEAYSEALRIDPLHPDALSNRASVYMRLNAIDEGISGYRAALIARPGDRNLEFNLAMALLLSGEYREGWELYESRVGSREMSLVRSPSFPSFDKQTDLSGKSVLVTSEQGLGDIIQFVRYCDVLASRGARVTLEAPATLASLLDNTRGISRVVSQSDNGEIYDYQCRLLSIPHLLELGEEGIAIEAPYLGVDPERRARWAGRLGDRCRPRVGLVWSGNPRHKNDKNRSISLSALLGGLPVEYEYIALQKEVNPSDMTVLTAAGITHLGNEIQDFSDTAAICEQVDLIVSVDTSVAHLAGALGKQTIILVPFSPDWRWGLDRNDTDWYRTAKLIRQSSSGNWQSALEKLRIELEDRFLTLSQDESSVLQANK